MLLALALPFIALAKPKPTILAHYMPWFQAKPMRKEWGWHWTMGKVDPEIVDNGRRRAAAHHHPLIGLYDSADPDVLECQTLLMKFAGIDGVLIDWYGTEDLYDYRDNHQNSLAMIAAVKKAGLKFAIVYEDQTVKNLVEKGKWTTDNAVANGNALMRWVDREWFASPSYVRLVGRPLWMVFGPQYYQDADWPKLFEGLKHRPTYLSLHYRRNTSDGAYDWPLPGGGTTGSDKHLDDFYVQANDWPSAVPVAFPRFQDYYAQAGLHASWGSIDDQGGKMYETTLRRALRSRWPVVQLATWNDWGEGTQIEPSVEFGYRDLEATQRLIRESWPLAYRAEDLRLPVALFKLRKSAGDERSKRACDAISGLLFAGKTDAARKALGLAK